MSLYAMLKPKGPNGFGYGSTAEDVTAGVDLTGKTILLTGCNSGIGLESMRVLAARGAHIIAAARSADKAREAAQGLDVTPVACELSEPASVRACVQAVKNTGRKLDVILCNAGIMALPRLEVRHGVELQLLTNHVGHFLLVTGLLGQLSETGRVVLVSSLAHRQAPRAGIEFDNLDGSRRYSSWGNYGQSKLANLLFARELARRLQGTKQTANALHPGVIQTNLTRHMMSLTSVGMAIAAPIAFKSIPQGAATQCYLAAHPDAARVSGQYYADCNPASSSRQSQDPALALRLWEVSEQLAARL
jgi:NAD(P)-dependent dehydrogenase (short-subunit alcohol dehydrogenase family)